MGLLLCPFRKKRKRKGEIRMKENKIKLLKRIDYGFLRIRFNQIDAKRCEEALEEIIKENKELRVENNVLKLQVDNPGGLL